MTMNPLTPGYAFACRRKKEGKGEEFCVIGTEKGAIYFAPFATNRFPVCLRIGPRSAFLSADAVERRRLLSEDREGWQTLDAASIVARCADKGGEGEKNVLYRIVRFHREVAERHHLAIATAWQIEVLEAIIAFWQGIPGREEWAESARRVCADVVDARNKEREWLQENILSPGESNGPPLLGIGTFRAYLGSEDFLTGTKAKKEREKGNFWKLSVLSLNTLPHLPSAYYLASPRTGGGGSAWLLTPRVQRWAQTQGKHAKGKTGFFHERGKEKYTFAKRNGKGTLAEFAVIAEREESWRFVPFERDFLSRCLTVDPCTAYRTAPAEKVMLGTQGNRNQWQDVSPASLVKMCAPRSEVVEEDNPLFTIMQYHCNVVQGNNLTIATAWQIEVLEAIIAFWQGIPGREEWAETARRVREEVVAARNEEHEWLQENIRTPEEPPSLFVTSTGLVDRTEIGATPLHVLSVRERLVREKTEKHFWSDKFRLYSDRLPHPQLPIPYQTDTLPDDTKRKVWNAWMPDSPAVQRWLTYWNLSQDHGKWREKSSERAHVRAVPHQESPPKTT